MKSCVAPRYCLFVTLMAEETVERIYARVECSGRDVTAHGPADGSAMVHGHVSGVRHGLTVVMVCLRAIYLHHRAETVA